jgi:hypothetical protein
VALEALPIDQLDLVPKHIAPCRERSCDSFRRKAAGDDLVDQLPADSILLEYDRHSISVASFVSLRDSCSHRQRVGCHVAPWLRWVAHVSLRVTCPGCAATSRSMDGRVNRGPWNFWGQNLSDKVDTAPAPIPPWVCRGGALAKPRGRLPHRQPHCSDSAIASRA